MAGAGPGRRMRWRRPGAPPPHPARSVIGAIARLKLRPAASPRMAAGMVRITFVVQGAGVDVDVDPSRPAGEDVRAALEKSGIGGDPGEWKARTAEGRVLDNGKSLIEEGIDKPTRLYLNKGPGRGG